MHRETRAQKYGHLWSREELILAFDLYCRIPFKKTEANNPDVVKLATLLNRSPGSVARKLGNFGSFDPQLKMRHVRGLVHAGKLDAAIWEEFNSDWNRLVLEAERLRSALEPKAKVQMAIDSGLSVPEGASERDAMRKTRVHQAFFREVILSSYEDTCCMTGLRIRECLVASHIVPWSVSEGHRTDPHNGLCLSATFDRLFDRGQGHFGLERSTESPTRFAHHSSPEYSVHSGNESTLTPGPDFGEYYTLGLWPIVLLSLASA